MARVICVAALALALATMVSAADTQHGRRASALLSRRGSGSVSAAAPVPASTLGGLMGWTAGTLPIVLVSAHGGKSKPKGWPKRRAGSVVASTGECLFLSTDPSPAVSAVGHEHEHEHEHVPDSDSCGIYTGAQYGVTDLVARVSAALEKRTGRKPFTVVSEVARKVLDPDRGVGSAAQGFAPAVAAYNTFHTYLRDAAGAAAGMCAAFPGAVADEKDPRTVGNRVLVVDLHGAGGDADGGTDISLMIKVRTSGDVRCCVMSEQKGRRRRAGGVGTV